MTLSVAVITKNEETNIADCLESVAWADEIILVDSGSTDETLAIAKRFTSKIYNVPFVDFSAQKNAALERATGDWIFFIDADERVPRELADEIVEIAKHKKGDCAYRVKRTTYFFGKRLHFSATQNDAPTRFFPRSKATFKQPVHEEVATNLPLRQLKNPLIHFSTKDLAHYQAKVRQYVPLEIQILRQKGKEANVLDLFLRPAGKFCYLYFFRLGILDGLTGLQFAALSTYYCFVKYWKYIYPAPNPSQEVFAQ